MKSPAPTLKWSEAEPAIEISTRQELDQALHRIAAPDLAEHPIIVVIYAHNYQVGIGLGLSVSFVHVEQYGSGQAERCLITVGPNRVEGKVPFFYLGTNRVEIPRRNLIPTQQARGILREFFDTGNRSANVEWEEMRL